MVLCGPPISPLGTFPGTFMNNSTPIIGSSLRALLGAQLGCGLAVSDAEEEPVFYLFNCGLGEGWRYPPRWSAAKLWWPHHAAHKEEQ